MNNVQKGEQLLAAIMVGASTPGGFAIADHPKYTSFDVTQNRCNALANAGALFKVKPPAGYVRYFTTEAAMRLFRAAFPAREVLAAAKKRTANPLIARKAYSQPAPRKDAEIVWPDHIKPVCRMMPPPRNQVVTHSFLHNGMGAM